MNRNLATFFKTVSVVLRKHSPEILTGIGIAGMVGTSVLAVKATPKALKAIEEEKKNQKVDKLSVKDTIKVSWKHYVPAAINGVASAGCIIGANSIHLRRRAALATAYTLSESALREYKEKVIETVGEKKEREVRDTAAKNKVAKDPVSNKTIIYTGKGDSLFYDDTCSRYFKSNIDKINKAVLDLNKRMRDEMEISLNEFYYEIGLEGNKVGDYLTWSIDDEYIDVSFSAVLVEDEPCTVMSFNSVPKHRD
jgi:hypothetical protein